MSQSYRCDECRARPARCESCAARRAARIRERRAQKREAGICTECPCKAQPGMSRCAAHRADNNARSLQSHTAAEWGADD